MEMAEIQEILWPTLKMLIAPALGASLAVMLVVRCLGGQRVGPLASLLAFAVAVYVSGFYVANSLSEEKPWQFETNRELNAHDMGRVLGWTLEKKPDPKPVEEGEEAPAVPPEDDPSLNRLPLFWVPFLAALAMLVEFVLPLLGISAGTGWAVRTGIAFFAGRLLTPALMRVEYPWLSWALGAVILLEWAVLTALARRWLDGVVPCALGVCCAAAGMVLALVTSYPSAYNEALLFGAALAGPALIAWKWPSDSSPAVAAIAVALPGLLLAGYNSLADPPPYLSFVLAGLAPLALLPMSLPFLARREHWSRWLPGLALPIIPAVLAVIWAIQAAPPAPKEEPVAMVTLGRAL